MTEEELSVIHKMVNNICYVSDKAPVIAALIHAKALEKASMRIENALDRVVRALYSIK